MGVFLSRSLLKNVTADTIVFLSSSRVERKNSRRIPTPHAPARSSKTLLPDHLFNLQIFFSAVRFGSKSTALICSLHHPNPEEDPRPYPPGCFFNPHVAPTPKKIRTFAQPGLVLILATSAI
ncbi:hypothetical protein PIB30_054169 [Stylosanthes scabra]|uniref:Uncharacterized protein n=1 Tax=Stylosanthes scabra TaxID=79078 RepID=A0ABU6UJI6_9FABA|nr:hypothetical protein [Stylosanthes scabra]